MAETLALDSFVSRLQAPVEKFDRDREHYLRANYSKAQARLDFIYPLFGALGWDVNNHARLSPKTREVIVEHGDTPGFPDYNFRIDGRTMFFVEAKAPHVPLNRTDVVMQAKS